MKWNSFMTKNCELKTAYNFSFKSGGIGFGKTSN